MTADHELEAYKLLHASQDKYVYFLLAAAGAAIALALNQTKGLPLNITQLPLGTAVLLWGFSFFFGCRNLTYKNATLYANTELLLVEDGRHNMAGGHPQMIAVASEAIRSAIENNSTKITRFGRWQFRCLVVGAIFYIAWHVYSMWLLTMQ